MEYLIGTGLLMSMVALCIAIEYVAPIERYSLKERVPGLTMQVTAGVGGALLSIPIGKLWNMIGAEAVSIPIARLVEPFGLLGFIASIIFGVALVDFLRYWRHRAEHRWFWPIHVVHHSPTELHAANSIGHPFQLIPEVLFVAIPLALIDFERPAAPLFVGLLNGFLITYIHSPVDFHWGPTLRKVFVDNRFHRIHHSIEPHHFDKNFSNIFTLWDRMFGTAYMPKPDEWPDVGVAGVRPPSNVLDFLAMPVRESSLGAPIHRLPNRPRRKSASRQPSNQAAP